MEQELRSLVASVTGLAVLRVNWGEHPQGAGQPYIVLHLISLASGHHQQGPEALERSRVQIDCYAPDFGTARQTAEAVKARLDFYRGGQFLGIFFDGLRLTREAVENDGDALYRASLDVIVNWRTNHG